MNMPDVNKKQLAQLWDLEWIPEIDAVARKYDFFRPNGEPDRAAAVRFMVRSELDRQHYQLTEDDLAWVSAELAKNNRKRSK